MQSIYSQFGISEQVLRYAEPVLTSLKERFQEIDETAEYNQLRIIKAMQDAHIGEANLKGTTGYGYDDIGRDGLERVYASYFHTEDALVRPQITCGTHALALALRPADARKVRDYPADSAEIRAYLHGEAIREAAGGMAAARDKAEKGWVLIAVDGYSCGFARLAGGVLKNHYPRGLRTKY